MKRMKQHLITGGLILGALVAPALASADATPVPTPTPLAWYQKITVDGYLDEYYQASFNQPEGTGSVASPDGYRAFDNTTNEFTFGGGELTLKQGDSASNTGYFLDLLLGPEAGLYSGDGSLNGVEIGQAYLTQAFGNATFTIGKFGTPIGYEVTYLPTNANFSRSLLFFNEPLYHVGLEMAYTLPDSLTGTLWYDDGNSTDGASGTGRDYGAQLAYAGIKNLNLTATWYLQDYLTTPATIDSSLNWANLIATYTATSELNFAGEYLLKDYCVLGNPYYPTNTPGFPNVDPIEQGYALYATYSPAMVANLSISPRFEQWFDPAGQWAAAGGLTGALGIAGPSTTDDYTLTVKYQMGPLAHMLEYRSDASDEEIFPTNYPKNPTFMSKINQTLTYAAVYAF
jgi:Putative beta-barrel porin-2, OmpL-like. bbp2